MTTVNYLRDTIVRSRRINNSLETLKPISVSPRTVRPSITHKDVSKPLEVDDYGMPFNLCYINEPGKVSFGIKDYDPGVYIPLHHHHTWELIVIDSISEGPGYIFFDNEWWRSDPGTAVFIPSEYPNAWSAGKKSFRMLWIYGGCLEEAGRVLDIGTRTNRAITLEEEAIASPPETWANPDMLNWHTAEDRFWTK